jgi:hypothetical protein
MAKVMNEILLFSCLAAFFILRAGQLNEEEDRHVKGSKRK